MDTLARLLKHKIRPENAYFKAHDFDFILSAPKEELHQFFIGLYGDHLLPATMHEIEKLLRGPDTIKGFNKDAAEIAAAKAGSPLYKKALLEDPSENLIRAHVATLDDWNGT